MAMTSKLVYKQGSGRSPEFYRAPAPIRTGASRPRTRSPGSSSCSRDVDPQSVACVSRDRQGEGGFIPMPMEFVRALRSLRAPRDSVRRRRGAVRLRPHRPVWAIQHHGVEPDLIVSGKTLGGGLRLRR
jgi:4-aminobutyrate aminotransferase-like enzyme